MSVLKVTSENYEREVLNSELPVVIDFWASWCGPCRLLAPIIEQFAAEYDGKLKVCKIDVDEEQEIAASFRVMSIPTVVMLKNGEVTATAVGYRSKHSLEEELGLNPPRLRNSDVFR